MKIKKIESEEGKDENKKEVKKREIVEKVRGKKYIDAKAKIDRNKTYGVVDAIKLVKNSTYSSFDGTMEVHLVVKKIGVSTNVALPNNAGKQKKIEVADEETVKKLEKGTVDFDILLSTAEFMPKLVSFAKILGPRGLMPNPKNGTIIKSEKDAAKFSANTLNLKTEKIAPLIHTTFGKVSQPDQELVDNLQVILTSEIKPQIVRVFIKSSMSPSVKLSL
ncbi:MAG: hypothetical protein AAB656_00190 [Patescibacteria group bacterium]